MILLFFSGYGDDSLLEYYKRFTDKILAERLQSSGAVLIEGTKGCGKDTFFFTAPMKAFEEML